VEEWQLARRCAQQHATRAAPGLSGVPVNADLLCDASDGLIGELANLVDDTRSRWGRWANLCPFWHDFELAAHRVAEAHRDVRIGRACLSGLGVWRPRARLIVVDVE